MAALLRKGMAKNLKRAYAAAAEGEPNKGKANKVGNNVPLYVALGMIGLSVGLGIYTAKQQFMHAPAVRVHKSRREMVSEVEEPERVARESENFINKSFFRKIARVQEFDNPVDDPIHGNPLIRDGQLESLKSVGVNPTGDNE